jgi:hypothetical protein
MSTIYAGDDARYEYDRKAFAHQLKVLQQMGFRDERINVEALKMSHGNVTKAFDLISAGNVKLPTNPAQSSLVPSQYSSASKQMRDMGFNDSVKNVEALKKSGGDVQGAVDELLKVKSAPRSNPVATMPRSNVTNTMPRTGELIGMKDNEG